MCEIVALPSFEGVLSVALVMQLCVTIDKGEGEGLEMPIIYVAT